MKISIEIDTLDIATRDGASVTFDPSKVDKAHLETIVANLFAYGVGQKVRDARSGAQARAEETGEDVAKISADMMTDAVAALYRGEWSQRGTGGGVDEFTVIARQILRSATKAKLGSKSPEWKAFEGLSTSDQNAKLDANIEANREALTAPVATKIAERKAAADAKRKLSGKLDISI